MTVMGSGNGLTETLSRLKVLTKASAIPLDWGLRIYELTNGQTNAYSHEQLFKDTNLSMSI